MSGRRYSRQRVGEEQKLKELKSAESLFSFHLYFTCFPEVHEKLDEYSTDVLLCVWLLYLMLRLLLPCNYNVSDSSDRLVSLNDDERDARSQVKEDRKKTTHEVFGARLGCDASNNEKRWEV